MADYATGPLCKLLRSPHRGLVAHVQGWVVQSPASLSFPMMIRYEDLKTRAMQSLQKVYGQLRLAIAGDVGAKAVGLSSFANTNGAADDLRLWRPADHQGLSVHTQGAFRKAPRYSQAWARPASPTRRAT